MDRRRDRMLARLDADKNGTVSAMEFETFIGGEFKKADKNGDGGVTFDEANIYKFAWRERVEKMLVPAADVQ